jgi:hypothetical protein
MSKWIVSAVVAAVLLIAGLPTLAVTMTHGGPSTARSSAAAADDAPDVPDDRDEADDSSDEKADGPGEDAPEKVNSKAKSHVKPPWAGGRHGKDRAAKDAWKKQWQKLSPEQRARKSAQLARDHAEGMKRWKACVAAGRDDCEKPWPPGLAKKR